jgi:hypothetical protein
MKDKKYYYVSFSYHDEHYKPDLVKGECIDEHPLVWVKKRNSARNTLIFTIISWQEIDKETYDVYDKKPVEDYEDYDPESL